MTRTSLALLTVALLLCAAAPASFAAGDDPRSVPDVIEPGVPQAVEVSLTELVVEIPIRVKAVGVQGHVESVTFEDLSLNGIPLDVDPYTAGFDLPESESRTLPDPLRVRVRFSEVAPGVLEEAIMPSDETVRIAGKIFARSRAASIASTL